MGEFHFLRPQFLWLLLVAIAVIGALARHQDSRRSWLKFVSAEKLDVLFSKTLLGNKIKRMFYLREGIISDFVKMATCFTDRGYTLKIEDAYRTATMQKALGEDQHILEKIVKQVIWESNGKIPSTEQFFRRLSVVAFCRLSVRVMRRRHRHSR